MKKIVLGLALLGVFGLASCKKSLFQNEKEVNQKIDESFSYEAMSSLAMLNSSSKAKLSSTSQSNSYAMGFTDSTEDIEVILAQVDVLNANKDKIKLVTKQSDRPEYKNLQEVSFIDFYQTEYTYSLYYNDVKESINQEIDDDDDEIEYENKISYQGLAVTGTNEYKFSFESKYETEGDEIELKTKFDIYTGENSYIRVKTGREEEKDEVENKYHYQIIENGRTVLNYVLKNEIEDNENETKIEYNGFELKIKEHISGKENYLYVKVDNQKKYLYKRVLNPDNTISYVLVDDSLVDF